MRILGFDTSAKTASVAIFEDGRLAAEIYLDSGFTHSETVLPMAKALLDSARLKPSDIDVFAVNVGPGSFTGLRIGIAAVKALAMSLNKKCAAVSTLEALAFCLEGTEETLCPVMDARCNQVYTAFFEHKEGLERLCPDRAISTDELFEDIKSINAKTGKKVLLIGDGAELCQRKFGEEFVCLAPKHLRLGRAFGTCLAAEIKIKNGETLSAGEIVPNYLRLAQAEREKLQREGKI